MFTKRGQITVFLIVGILILSITLFILFSNSSTMQQFFNVKSEQDRTVLSGAVEQFVESCISKTGKDALFFIARHGGYYALPEQSHLLFSVPYYWLEDHSVMPTKEQVELQLSLYMNRELSFCTQHFLSFREQGFEITEEEITTETVIREEDVLFRVTFPLTIAKGDIVKKTGLFAIAVPSRLNTIYHLLVQFLALQKDDPQNVCISCLLSLSIPENLRVEMDQIDNDELLFSIIDEQEVFEKIPFTYRFLNRYEAETNEETQ